jgi:hypothetical protein
MKGMDIIMKNKTIKKVIASCLLGLTIFSTNSIKANAEWRQNTSGWWYTEGTSYATGWREIEGKWYYFYSSGYMAFNTTIDGYALSSSGQWITINNTADSLESNQLIEVYGGDLSGTRKANVKVDIGFGNREYYAYTNQYGQLVKVTAKKIVLQDDSTEAVNSKGRYYDDEAKVPGVESASLDEGHAIADSLGGVSNAYNITPQNSTLNRSGDQAYMEDTIRKAGGCADFTAIITYPNTTTQIPNHYSYTYTINGNVIHDEFDNINPDEYNVNTGVYNSDTKVNNSTNNTTVTTDSNKDSERTVYWTPSGKSYHYDKNCSTLSRSKVINSGTIEECGKTDACDKCSK